jgi:Ca2+-binding RTX toxin-like protein
VSAAGVSASNSIQFTGTTATGVNDSVVGGLGNDSFTFSTSAAADALTATDSVDGGAGNDLLTIATGTTALTAATLTAVANIERLTVTGTTGGVGTITLADANFASVTGATINASSLTTGALLLTASAEDDSSFNITSGGGADSIVGGQLADTINAGSGADTIQGGLLADSLTGGTGADVFQYTLVTHSNSSNTDSITDFTSGTDKLNVTLDYSTLVSIVTVDATVQTARAGVTLAQDNLSGNRGQAVYDTTGSALYINVNGDNLLTTSDYKININPASTATATIAEGDINFVITGGTNADVITAGGGADTIDGGAGADSITGGAGADSITAGTGADTIVGGLGDDTVLLGATGDADRVWLASTGTDTITGFSLAAADADKLVVSANGSMGIAIAGGAAVAANQAAAASGSVFINANGGAADYTQAEVIALLVTTAAANKYTVAASSKYILVETRGGNSQIWYINNDGTAAIATSEVTKVGIVDATIAFADLA